jgi:ribonuclease BN (tRNA processing enzyme)
MRVLASVAVAAVLLMTGGGAAPAPSTTLTLLGTAGGPGAKVDRAGIASLVTVGDRRYLVDAGDGVTRQLARAGLSEGDIHHVFFTHLHDDHTVGLPALMSFYFTGNRTGQGMELVGPPGMDGLLRGVLAYLQTNARIRMTENHLPNAPEALFSARTVQPGLIYQDAAVKVTAVENTHYRLTADRFGDSDKSYALRFETQDRVVVFTGDTGDSTAVQALAKDADILVSEMVTGDGPRAVPPDVQAHMVQEHLSPTQVGQMAAAAHVRRLVLSHIQVVTEKDLAEIRRYYSGPVSVGQDLATF